MIILSGAASNFQDPREGTRLISKFTEGYYFKLWCRSGKFSAPPPPDAPLDSLGTESGKCSVITNIVQGTPLQLSKFE